MAVTVAVETVISDHYNAQLRELNEKGLVDGDYEHLRKVCAHIAKNRLIVSSTQS